MTKPFDTQALVEQLKAQGLPIAEEAAEKLVKTVLVWVKDSAALHDNTLVKALVPMVVDTVEPLIKTQLDKIDGQVG